MSKPIAILLLLLCYATLGLAQKNFVKEADSQFRIAELPKANPSLINTNTIATTATGLPIQVIEIGKSQNPAIAIVGNVDGSHLLGAELALQFAEMLAENQSDDSIKQILDNTSFLIIPNVSPDAYAQATAALKYERIENARKMDNDRDGEFDEDGPDDLNGDGLITMMRVKHPTGTYMPHPADNRVLVKADITKGEEGMYLLLQEGLDNDQDGKYNEDGPGGVAFNHNLPYKYPNFTSFAGPHPVSEPETKGVLDYLFDQWNVFAVMSFGEADNLTAPTKFNEASANKRVVTSWQKNDVELNKLISSLYKETVNTDAAPTAPSLQGDFHNWAYYHYGRFSFSTPAWWSPKFEMPKDSIQAAKYIKNEDNNKHVDLLRTAAQQGRNIFTEWTVVDHPDFPDYEVEVGGFHPYATSLPPFKEVESIAEKHNAFLLQLAAARPNLNVNDIKTESLGGGLYRITLNVVNTGLLPTISELGNRNQWVKRVKAQLKPTSTQKIVSGNKIQFVKPLAHKESQSLSWIVQGKGELAFELGAPHVGIETIKVTLK